MTRSKGFTLIELLIVVAILGVLVAMLIATIDPFEQIKKSQDATQKNSAVEVLDANMRYYSTHLFMPWTNDVSCLSQIGLGNTLANTPSCLADLTNDGELKQSFVSDTNALDKIYLSNCGNDQVVCYNPQSLSQNHDPNTRYNQYGAIREGCPATDGVSNDCYWCSDTSTCATDVGYVPPSPSGSDSIIGSLVSALFPSPTPTPIPTPTATPTPKPTPTPTPCKTYVNNVGLDADHDGYYVTGSVGTKCNLGSKSINFRTYYSTDGANFSWLSTSQALSNTQFDCCDLDQKTHPGQVGYFSTPDACGRFDFNCDGKLTTFYTYQATGTLIPAASAYITSVPECQNYPNSYISTGVSSASSIPCGAYFAQSGDVLCAKTFQCYTNSNCTGTEYAGGSPNYYFGGYTNQMCN